MRDGRVTELPGIGKTLEEKLQTLIETGDTTQAQKLRAQFPAGADRDDAPAGLRPEARAAALRRARASTRSRRCARAAEQQKLRGLRGFGAKVEEKLLEPLAAGSDGTPAPRVLLSRAQPIAEQVVDALRAAPGAERVEVAGSLRRLGRLRQGPRRDRHGGRPAALVQGADRAAARRVRRLVRRRRRAGHDLLGHEGRPQGRRARPVRQRAAALHRLQGRTTSRCARRRSGAGCTSPSTGSSTTRRARRCAARPRRRSTSGSGCAWIPPELREGRGELEAAAAKGALPELIELADLRGDLHSHTTLSDGRQDVEAMVEGAREARLRVPRDHRPLGDARVRQPRRRRTRCARRSSACARSTRARRLRPADRDGDQRAARRLARLRRRAAGRARLGRRVACTRRSACPRRR